MNIPEFVKLMFCICPYDVELSIVIKRGKGESPAYNFIWNCAKENVQFIEEIRLIDIGPNSFHDVIHNAATYFVKREVGGKKVVDFESIGFKECEWKPNSVLCDCCKDSLRQLYWRKENGSDVNYCIDCIEKEIERNSKRTPAKTNLLEQYFDEIDATPQTVTKESNPFQKFFEEWCIRLGLTQWKFGPMHSDSCDRCNKNNVQLYVKQNDAPYPPSYFCYACVLEVINESCFGEGDCDKITSPKVSSILTEVKRDK